MEAQGVWIDYTDYDLKRAFHSRGYASVDFSKVPGQYWDVISQHIGEEKFSSRFEMWMPENLEETVEERK